MKIPKKFKLFGHTISVEYTDTLMQEEDKVGMALFRENKIILQKNNKGIPMLKDQIEQIFLHELVHYLFYFSDNEELAHCEEAVNIVSQLLHQYMVTCEGELK